VPLEYQPRTLAEKLKGLSSAEAEELGQDIVRRWVLGQPDAQMKDIVKSRLDQWRSRFDPDSSRDDDDHLAPLRNADSSTSLSCAQDSSLRLAAPPLRA